MDFLGSQTAHALGPKAVSLPGSFRDPSGYLFVRDGVLYRLVRESYRPHYDLLLTSGLYDELVGEGLLVPHTEESLSLSPELGAYKVLKPERVPFISYPAEWSFSQLKDAALLTLTIAEKAFARGMILKDATAYNVQFLRGKPIFIDTLSFESYETGTPWVAYRQFCQHFLAPLALMAYRDVRLGKLFQLFIDGVPLDLASSLLPWRTKWNLHLQLHLHLHARSQRQYADKGDAASRKVASGVVSPNAVRGIFDGLRSAVTKLEWRPEGTEWADYYEATNYTEASMKEKEALVHSFVAKRNPSVVWDLGANTGAFSRVAAKVARSVMSFDIDPAAVEKNYRMARRGGDAQILPLVLDLTNPSPAIGWDLDERMSFKDRGPADLVLALALIHHLAISNNVPLRNLAAFFASVCRALVIEFVPKSDSQVKRLLASRKDIFPEYTPAGFESAFSEYFTIETSSPVPGSERTLYLMTSRT